ncbi:hypothetical protein Vretimale_17561, partial [Volvox reticuliferus]
MASMIGHTAALTKGDDLGDGRAYVVISSSVVSNLALGRPTFASSVYQERSGIYHHMRAVDGVTQYGTLNFSEPQLYQSATGDQSPWISVDLGTPSVITQVVIWSRCDIFGNSFKPSSLHIGNVSIQEYADNSYLTRNPLVWSWTQSTAVPQCTSYPINFTTPVIGRWVVLQNPGEYLQLTELEVFGFQGSFVDSPPNLAFGRPAYSSSSSLLYPTPPMTCLAPKLPAIAVDGITQHPFGLDLTLPQVFQTDEKDLDTWFSVDLGVLAFITQVVIWSRCDGYEYHMRNAELRIGNISIRYSNDTSRLASNPLVWKQTTNMRRCASMIAAFDPPRLGRWVTLQ